jgi:hypothetical protein
MMKELAEAEKEAIEEARQRAIAEAEAADIQKLELNPEQLKAEAQKRLQEGIERTRQRARERVVGLSQWSVNLIPNLREAEEKTRESFERRATEAMIRGYEEGRRAVRGVAEATQETAEYYGLDREKVQNWKQIVEALPHKASEAFDTMGDEERLNRALIDLREKAKQAAHPVIEEVRKKLNALSS